jgi:trans-aconitate 2-methyltransferase
VAWDPAQYLKYADERRRPALDLIARVPLDAPASVVDLGCGAGNVTRLLAERWRNASILGIDNSAAMLARAREDTGADPRFEWIEGDLATWQPRHPVDLLFSNAALHWLDAHATLFPRLFSLVAPGGALAVQMPANHAAPSHVLLAEVVTSARWRARLAPLLRPTPVAPMATYFAMLAPDAQEVDAWTTEYLHVLPPARQGVHPVVAWTRGTALTPFLAALDAEAQRSFLADYAERIAQAYRPLPDGRVLFAFRRVFVVATRHDSATRASSKR